MSEEQLLENRATAPEQVAVYICPQCKRAKGTDGAWCKLTAFEVGFMILHEDRVVRVDERCPECRETKDVHSER